MRSPNVIFKAENVSKDFKLGKEDILSAVDGITFDIREGECLGVIGESGCGKSTLAKIITGVETPSGGEAELLGKNIFNLKKREMNNVRRDMQMIFQNASGVVSPKMKLKTFLLEPYKNYKIMPENEAKKHISEMLKKVRLNDEVLDKYGHQLSGGEMQRVCISRAFGINPKFLLCDEITSALDVSVQDDVMKLFRQTQQEYGTACLFICHDLALVQNNTDRVMIMYLGQAVEILKSKDLSSKAMHPYTRGLLESMLLIGTDPNSKLKTMAGEPISPINPKPCCRFSARCPKATERCFSEKPVLKQISPGHQVACFLY